MTNGEWRMANGELWNSIYVYLCQIEGLKQPIKKDRIPSIPNPDKQEMTNDE